MIVKAKKVRSFAKIPTKGTAKSAGHDLYACIPIPLVIRAKSHEVIPTGLSFEIPEGYDMYIYPRSGISTKNGIRLSNCVAVIDNDYRGEVMIPLQNDHDEDFIIQPGMRIAQAVLHEKVVWDIEEADELSKTERGEGGFGSTGSF